MAILEAKGLTVDIPTEDGTVHAVRNVSFAIRPGSLFGIAGESGSGKSVLTQAVMGLLPNADISGEVWFEGIFSVMPFGKPASARSALAFSGSPLASGEGYRSKLW